MAAKQIPRYADPVYQAAHDDAFRNPFTEGIPTVLPPGVTREDFDSALNRIAATLGEHAVFRGESLREYVDPYEFPEGGYEPKVPGAAVW